MATTKNGPYSLTVPIDIGNAKDAAKAVKVALIDGSGKVLQSQTVETSGRQPAAKFSLDALPRGARVVVGPQDADDESLPKLQTVSANVPSSLFKRGTDAKLQPVLIPQYYWPWWFQWCRDFTITGTVICPDGKPVPGAQVCAFDVDWFWIWQSKQQIGCDVTDANGFFEIKFRWCCGWWPWWWWYQRAWQVDLKLATELYATLPPELRIKPIPLPDPAPNLRAIEAMIPASRMPAKLPPAAPVRQRAIHTKAAGAGLELNELRDTTSAFFNRAEALRPALAALLPASKYNIWPWYPWYPWRDCNPDVIFHVTQPCGGDFKVIVDQDYSQTQWDIPTSYNVTLVANNDACCADDTPCGDPCLSITHVCDIHRSAVDQTTGSATAGLAYPGAASGMSPQDENADRPFAEGIYVQGLPQCMGDDVDWYEVEYAQYDTSTGWGSYAPVPIGSLGAISRTYWTSDSSPWATLTFAPTVVGGHTVYPSRKKLETSLVAPWVCFSGCQLLFLWLTNSSAWQDGTYRLRLRAYKEQPAGTLVEQLLDPCDEGDPNEIVITLDNRPMPDLAHLPPGTPDHPCGPGTVHTCTKEPDVDVVEVRLVRGDGTIETILPCTIHTRQPNDTIEIDFSVDDRDDHLGRYTLHATYGENQSSDLADGTTTLTPLTADAVGPTYRQALTQGATSPKWHGGTITVKVPLAQMAAKFPDPCCYQIELFAEKRTIVGCDQRYLHNNLAEYSFFY